MGSALTLKHKIVLSPEETDKILSWAAICGSIETIKEYLPKEKRKNEKLVSLAAKNGHLNICLYLEAYLENTTFMNRKLLMSPYDHVVNFIIKHDPNNILLEKEHLLKLVHKNRLLAIKFLTKNPVNCEQLYKIESDIKILLEKGYFEMVIHLFKIGSKIFLSHYEFVVKNSEAHFLAKTMIDIDCKNYMSSSIRYHIAKLFIENFNVKMVEPCFDERQSHLAYKPNDVEGMVKHMELIKFLPRRHEHSLLCVVIECGNYELVKYLLSDIHNFSEDEANKIGEYGTVEMLKYVVDKMHCSNLDITNFAHKIFCAAISVNRKDIFKYVIDNRLLFKPFLSSSLKWLRLAIGTLDIETVCYTFSFANILITNEILVIACSSNVEIFKYFEAKAVEHGLKIITLDLIKEVVLCGKFDIFQYLISNRYYDINTPNAYRDMKTCTSSILNLECLTYIFSLFDPNSNYLSNLRYDHIIGYATYIDISIRELHFFSLISRKHKHRVFNRGLRHTSDTAIFRTFKMTYEWKLLTDRANHKNKFLKFIYRPTSQHIQLIFI
jgi:hypothetical protein